MCSYETAVDPSATLDPSEVSTLERLGQNGRGLVVLLIASSGSPVNELAIISSQCQN
jgi:hypothetical protein